MTHSVRMALALIATYVTSIVVNLAIGLFASDSSDAVVENFALLGGLMGVLVFYCVMMTVRIFLVTNATSTRYVDRGIASLLAGTVVSGGISGVLLIYSGAMFLAFVACPSENLLDEEVDRRKDQSMREFGLNTERPMTVVALVLLMAVISLVVFAWLRATSSTP